MTEIVTAAGAGSGDYFRRYLPKSRALQILKKKSFYLSDPKNWQDRNDITSIDKYKHENNISTFRAICFTEGIEKFHHWKIYGYSRSLVSILFSKGGLKDHFNNQEFNGLTGHFDKVQYQSSQNQILITRKNLPFIKLNAYEGEQEYRFTLEGGADAAMPTWLSFDAELVARVVVSPWMKDELLSNFSTEVKKISGLKHVDVVRSTVLEKTEWTEKISALSF